MKWSWPLLVFLPLIAAAVESRAGDGAARIRFGVACLPDCVGGYVCDDYCPKSAPCVRPLSCFRCDDYCPKTMPCVQPVQCFGCDDYCRKCPPAVCCPQRNWSPCHPSLPPGGGKGVLPWIKVFP
jgi:hypothetical protein